ncbi:MAG: GTP 3',8-cyclase MoaA [Alphaproteobacteria bacterium]
MRASGAAARPVRHGRQRRGMLDSFGRTITYLRVSVTDRCDLRCRYCMDEAMTFLPRQDLLSLEEMDRVCSAFIRRGVTKLRITGGEPLIRRGVMTLFRSLGRHLETGALKELAVTSNGTRLAGHAAELAACGVKRINISLDTLNPDRFRELTRRGDIRRTLEGIDAAAAAGLRVKINAVAMRGVNEDEIDNLIRWCGERGFDLTFIETMPLGEAGASSTEYYLPLSVVRARIAKSWTVRETDHHTGGPARYVEIAETGHRVGFITPLTHSFCESCNRVRLTCTGTLYMCLGQENSYDLRAPLRRSEGNEALECAIDDAIRTKPRGHDFIIDRRDSRPALSRHINLTGG